MTAEKQRAQTPDLQRGLGVLKAELATMPGTPGVYRMLDSAASVLYVGKAKNLKKRVASYTRLGQLPIRLKRMVAATRTMEIISTHTETEALLLEANLIKRLKPRYNVVLRDDKSFPHIFLRTGHPWAQITKHRGAQTAEGEYFGPFASVGAVNNTLNTLQKIFLLRSCSDAVFDSRTRPCLLYQIKRCSAPCVGKIKAEEYRTLVEEARAFLAGKDTGIQKRLAAEMESASRSRGYERAAAFRDRLKALTQVQARQSVNAAGLGDADVMAIAKSAGQSCVQVFFFRSGQNWGNRSYFPRHSPEEGPEAILSAFIAQFYAGRSPPGCVLVNVAPEGLSLLEKALGEKSGRRVEIAKPVRGFRKSLVAEAARNAKLALARKLAENTAQAEAFRGLAQLFDFEGELERIEVYDNSHVSGANAVGAMVAATPEGFLKNAYRKFNIRTPDMAPGDDIGMMREVFARRFGRLVKEDPDRAKGQWPDLVLIDGGAGQLSAALESLASLGVEDVAVVAISKGPDRNAGRERFHIKGKSPFTLPPASPELYFLQRLRDEAHRFAVLAHRARRTRQAFASALDEVPGIGPKRKRALLNHFGSASAVAEAGIQDLAAAPGINRALAETIYGHFHPEG